MEEEKKPRRRVQWDEEKLKETEKYRGTFQKIDEPKTPYRPNQEVPLSQLSQTKRSKTKTKLSSNSSWKKV